MICGSGKLTCENVEMCPLALSWRCQHWWSGGHSSTASFMTKTPKWLAKQRGEPRSANNKKAKKGQSVAVASSPPVPMWNNRPQIGNWSTDCFFNWSVAWGFGGFEKNFDLLVLNQPGASRSHSTSVGTSRQE